MADTRQGLNCTLSYPKGNANQQYRLRVDQVNHGIQMIADESAGRNTRAYYPHRSAPMQITIRPLLKGYDERKAFSDWLQAYADYLMDPGLPAGIGFPAIRIQIPSRNIDLYGLPLQGYEWGDTIGSMLWTPSVVFETVRDPQDTTTWTPSYITPGPANDPDMKYFWPTGTQLGDNQVPSGSYTTVLGTAQGTGSDPGQPPATGGYYGPPGGVGSQAADYGD